MLDVIADFWKPVKRAQSQEKLQPDQLQIGSSLGFGFVPQASLSGRRLHVSAINTYQFGDESLTSFVLTQEKDAGASMIVAESEGEYYLAISRRISLNDRTRLFDMQELENVMNKKDVVRLACRDTIPELKGWVVQSYKREIQDLKGRIYKGDFRKTPLPANSEAQEFEYTLLVSDSNEHAIEIERYGDGRIELYATVYRRMSDIGEITHPAPVEVTRPDIRLASGPTQIPAMASKPAVTQAAAAPVISSPAKPAEQPTAPVVAPAEKPQPINLQELPKPVAPKSEEKPAEASKAAEHVKPAPQETLKSNGLFSPVEKSPMEALASKAGALLSTPAELPKASLQIQPKLPETFIKQEIKAVSTNPNAPKSFDNDAIECDLRVANKIIDEAIRNEMRLTDIVRRIIELPVAYPESVQIPMSLSDEDYALLAIRYGISSSDRNAIKRRILEDLNDFSGSQKQAKAA